MTYFFIGLIIGFAIGIFFVGCLTYSRHNIDETQSDGCMPTKLKKKTFLALVFRRNTDYGSGSDY